MRYSKYWSAARTWHIGNFCLCTSEHVGEVADLLRSPQWPNTLHESSRLWFGPLASSNDFHQFWYLQNGWLIIQMSIYLYLLSLIRISPGLKTPFAPWIRHVLRQLDHRWDFSGGKRNSCNSAAFDANNWRTSAVSGGRFDNGLKICYCRSLPYGIAGSLRLGVMHTKAKTLIPLDNLYA